MIGQHFLHNNAVAIDVYVETNTSNSRLTTSDVHCNQTLPIQFDCIFTFKFHVDIAKSELALPTSNSAMCSPFILPHFPQTEQFVLHTS